ncbi:MAG: glycosyltransferase family 39 protein [Anaerolineae bacterium]|nr:glycosyltransferase family 39 protein [Phycisphaerae bacterium]
MKSIDPFNEDSRRRRSELLTCFAVALIVFTFALGRRDIVTSHEGRVAQTARTMADSGWPWNARPVHVSGFVESNESQRLAPAQLPGDRDTVNPWLFPVINDAIRLQKPPLPYWVTAVVFKLFGVSEFNARIVPALLGALSTLLIWDLALLILGHRAAIPAAIVWITTQFVVDEFRKSMADPYLAFFTLLALWGWWRCERGRNILAWIALSLGALAKGPVIFIHIIPAIICAKIFLRRRTGSASWISHAIGALLFIAIVLPWPALVLREAPDAWRMWWYESGGEVSGQNIEKARPWWTYLASSFQLALPWTPVWIAGMVLAVMRSKRRFWAPRNRRRLFALSWYVIVLAFFSLVSVKKDAYLLPLMPAQTLIIADALITMRAAWARRRANYQMSIVLAAAQCAIGIGFGIGLFLAIYSSKTRDAMGLAICAAGVLMAVYAIRSIVNGKPNSWLLTQAAAYALLLIGLIGFHASAKDNARSPKRFAAAMAQYLRTTDVPLLVSRLPEEASFYLPLGLRDDPNASRVLIVVDKSRKDPPVDARRLSDLLNGAIIRGFQRVDLNVDDGGDRYQFFDVIVDRDRA